MKRLIVLALPSLLALAGCSNLPEVTSWLTPYKIDIRQGNFVTQEMVAQLKLGQSRDQVRFILGTSLLTDAFHADRWDYVYRFQPGHGEVQQRRMSVYFADGKLARIDGDVVTNPPAAAGSAPAQTAARVIEIGPAAGAKDQSKAKPEPDKPAPASK
ncbi:MAG: outer membrane protein assembly factor BamE [Proteobacteria bacterium]|nr:outer membrane protein assembly factor BamE [Pseudomonadota bacterium]